MVSGSYRMPERSVQVFSVGEAVVGVPVGDIVGASVGVAVGESLGAGVGLSVGGSVGGMEAVSHRLLTLIVLRHGLHPMLVTVPDSDSDIIPATAAPSTYSDTFPLLRTTRIVCMRLVSSVVLPCSLAPPQGEEPS